MAINKKLINFKKKEDFLKEKEAGNILETSIVFVDDSKEIYTHNTTFGNQTPDMYAQEGEDGYIMNNIVEITPIYEEIEGLVYEDIFELTLNAQSQEGNGWYYGTVSLSTNKIEADAVYRVIINDVIYDNVKAQDGKYFADNYDGDTSPLYENANFTISGLRIGSSNGSLYLKDEIYDGTFKIQKVEKGIIKNEIGTKPFVKMDVLPIMDIVEEEVEVILDNYRFNPYYTGSFWNGGNLPINLYNLTNGGQIDMTFKVIIGDEVYDNLKLKGGTTNLADNYGSEYGSPLYEGSNFTIMTNSLYTRNEIKNPVISIYRKIKDGYTVIKKEYIPNLPTFDKYNRWVDLTGKVEITKGYPQAINLLNSNFKLNNDAIYRVDIDGERYYDLVPFKNGSYWNLCPITYSSNVTIPDGANWKVQLRSSSYEWFDLFNTEEIVGKTIQIFKKVNDKEAIIADELPIEQYVGNSEDVIMSQKAVTDALDDINVKIDTENNLLKARINELEELLNNTVYRLDNLNLFDDGTY